MAPARWFYLAPEDEARLRSMMEALGGPAGETAQWILEDESRWNGLCGIADLYAHQEPEGETWKDAERQWREVQNAAHGLNAALESLGKFACAIRLDAGARTPGLWESVREYLHPSPGAAFAPPVHDLEWFAKVAVEECKRMKVQCNGARRGRKNGCEENGKLAFLIHNLSTFIEAPKCKPIHTRRIAAVVHAWATGRTACLENSRFGEGAIKLIKAVEKVPRTPR